MAMLRSASSLRANVIRNSIFFVTIKNKKKFNFSLIIKNDYFK